MEITTWVIITLSSLLGLTCCVTTTLILILVGIIIFAIIQRQAIMGFRKWYIQTKGVWDKRMFDNPDLKSFLKWYKWAPRDIMSKQDDAVMGKVNQLLKDDLMKGQMASGTPDQLPPKKPPGGVTEHPPPPMPGGDKPPYDQGVEIEDEIIIPIVQGD